MFRGGTVCNPVLSEREDMNSFQPVLSPENVSPLTWETADTFSLSTSITNAGCMVSDFGTSVCQNWTQTESFELLTSDFWIIFSAVANILSPHYSSMTVLTTFIKVQIGEVIFVFFYFCFFYSLISRLLRLLPI